ncbi:MAG TPA: FAD:protein FMN transferase [Actinomycetes bacterium]|nr:FAD:protein FMN transferase [Actinomycetes bacterium]
MRHQGHPRLTSRQVATCWLPAMGTQVELLAVDAPGGALAAARSRLAELQARWSRFRPDSEISTLNRAAGRPVAVSPETLTLLALAVLGWQSTAGRFDPTVLDALEAAGYDRSIDQLPADGPATDGVRPAPGPASGLAGLGIDAQAGTVALPAGTRLDLGGIAKGYAADLLCAQLRASGAAGACVNIGGDLRVSGTAPQGGPWTIAVSHPRGGQAATLLLTEGAAATSSPLQRAWQAGGRPAHHLIDPHTGQPAQIRILQVTAVAAEAWRAEVATKAVFLAGLPDALPLATRLGAEALIVDQDGGLHLTARLQPPLTPQVGTP